MCLVHQLDAPLCEAVSGTNINTRTGSKVTNGKRLDPGVLGCGWSRSAFPSARKWGLTVVGHDPHGMWRSTGAAGRKSRSERVRIVSRVVIRVGEDVQKKIYYLTQSGPLWTGQDDSRQTGGVSNHVSPPPSSLNFFFLPPIFISISLAQPTEGVKTHHTGYRTHQSPPPPPWTAMTI